MTSPPPQILHRDERIVVLDKPTGLLTVPGIGPEKADCLAARVSAEIPGARIVHRLDRDTSGVIVMALDAEAHRELSRQFHDRVVEKVYVALVAGAPADDSGTIDLAMRKDIDDPPRQKIDPVHGRRAVTAWRVIDRENGRSRIELRPETGRSHQLRVHLKALGCPVLGDDLYAPREAREAAPRLMLHALRLGFAHPETAEPVTFEAACPF